MRFPPADPRTHAGWRCGFRHRGRRGLANAGDRRALGRDQRRVRRDRRAIRRPARRGRFSSTRRERRAGGRPLRPAPAGPGVHQPARAHAGCRQLHCVGRPQLPARHPHQWFRAGGCGDLRPARAALAAAAAGATSPRPNRPDIAGASTAARGLRVGGRVSFIAETRLFYFRSYDLHFVMEDALPLVNDLVAGIGTIRFNPIILNAQAGWRSGSDGQACDGVGNLCARSQN